MDISLLNILRTVSWDFQRDMAKSYANALKNSIEIHLPNDIQKQEGYFLSKKGTKSMKGDFQDKLYVGNIRNVERHLYWNDEELADDDEVVDVVFIDGPVTRDGGACTYGTKDYRDQVLYANTIPQVKGHVFIINTPGGESACRNDYDLMIADCRDKNKPTVAFVDGMCYSSGVNLSSRCDRTIVMNPKDGYGCIGSMAAFWATPDGAVDQDGSRYVEIVGDESPEKNGYWREAAAGEYEKLKAVINKDTSDFIDTVRENRPLVEDYMLTGATFEAQEVMPALVDEIGDFKRAVNCVFDLASGKLSAARFAKKADDEKVEEQPTTQPSVEPEPEKEPEPGNDPKPDPSELPTPEDPEDESESNHKINNNMTEEKKELATIEQPETEQVNTSPEETPLGEKPDNNEDDPEKKKEEPNDDPDSGENCGNNDTPDKDDAAAKAIIANLDNKIIAKDKAIAEKDNEINNLKTMLEKSKKENNDAIAQLKKQIAELHKEVKELASEPTPMTEGTEAPKDNGTGVPETGTVKSVVTADMSADEIRKRLREQDKAIATKRRRM